MSNTKSPSWLANAIFYEIYPQSFSDSNGDGIGDLQGIIQKLDYLKDLGANASWLNPIFESPFFDAGYDVTDFYKIAPRYGTMADLDDLIKACHQRGMRLVLDLVIGHTSIESKWFKESCRATPNKYSDRYIWNHSVWQTLDDIPCIRGFSERDGSCAVNFFSIQPALNFGFQNIKHPDYEESITDPGPQSTIKAMEDVILFYLKRGVDGFRVDMAGWIVKRDPEKKGTIAVWNQIFDKVRNEFPEAFFVAEWDNPDDSLRAGFDSDFILQNGDNPVHATLTRCEHPYFSFHDQEGSASSFIKDYLRYKKEADAMSHYVSMISGNHDEVRLSKTLNKEESKMYLSFMYALPNIPFLYYGDEIGMEYVPGLLSKEGGYMRTGSRTPMQWDASKLAGFSVNEKTYLPLAPGRQGLSVEEQKKDPDSLLRFVQELLALKKAYRPLDNDAEFTLVEDGSGKKPLAFITAKNGQRILSVFNPSSKKESVICKDNGKFVLQLGECEKRPETMLIGPRSACYFLID